MNNLALTCVSAAFAGLSVLGAATLAAEEADHRAIIAQAHQKYEAAIADRDYQALADRYAENAIHMSAAGGVLEGREQIRQYFEQQQLQRIEIRGERVDPVGETIVIDTGTFTVRLPDEAGGGEMELEYLAVAELGADPLIHHLAAFAPRRLPDAPAQQ